MLTLDFIFPSEHDFEGLPIPRSELNYALRAIENSATVFGGTLRMFPCSLDGGEGYTLSIIVPHYHPEDHAPEYQDGIRNLAAFIKNKLGQDSIIVTKTEVECEII